MYYIVLPNRNVDRACGGIGAFVCIDTVFQLLKAQNRKVDILDIVDEMQKSRSSLVETFVSNMSLIFVTADED